MFFLYDWALPMLLQADAGATLHLVDAAETVVLAVQKAASSRLSRASNVPPGWVTSFGVQVPSLSVLLAGLGNPRGNTYAVYDPEHWDETPQAEQDDPLGYASQFKLAARGAGLIPVVAPSCTLLHSFPPPKRRPRTKFDRCLKLVVSPMAAHGDAVDCQIQYSAVDPDEYVRLAQKAVNLCRAVNPSVKVITQLSTNPAIGVTVDRLVECFERTRGFVDGHWLILDGEAGRADSIELVRRLASVS